MYAEWVKRRLPKQPHEVIICQMCLFVACWRVPLPPRGQKSITVALRWIESFWQSIAVILCLLSLLFGAVRSHQSSWRYSRWMEDSLLWWALRPRQIGSGWSRASLSAVKVSPVISLGAKGSPVPAPSCLSWLRHLSNSQLFLSCAVQKEIEDPQLLQAEVVSTDTVADSTEVTRSWQNVFYAHSSEVNFVYTMHKLVVEIHFLKSFI